MISPVSVRVEKIVCLNKPLTWFHGHFITLCKELPKDGKCLAVLKKILVVIFAPLAYPIFGFLALFAHVPCLQGTRTTRSLDGISSASSSSGSSSSTNGFNSSATLTGGSSTVLSPSQNLRPLDTRAFLSNIKGAIQEYVRTIITPQRIGDIRGCLTTYISLSAVNNPTDVKHHLLAIDTPLLDNGSEPLTMNTNGEEEVIRGIVQKLGASTTGIEVKWVVICQLSETSELRAEWKGRPEFQAREWLLIRGKFEGVSFVNSSHQSIVASGITRSFGMQSRENVVQNLSSQLTSENIRYWNREMDRIEATDRSKIT